MGLVAVVVQPNISIELTQKQKRPGVRLVLDEMDGLLPRAGWGSFMFSVEEQHGLFELSFQLRTMHPSNHHFNKLNKYCP